MGLDMAQHGETSKILAMAQNWTFGIRRIAQLLSQETSAVASPHLRQFASLKHHGRSAAVSCRWR